MQGAREFLTEIETLSELRHDNLVSLIGYCSAHKEMIIVYEYMACGTLADHLYKLARCSSNCSSLTWKQRLNICIGAAQGLDYLHTGRRVIHRDVKPSNILLGENFVAKVSDFGLSKLEDRSKLQSYLSTKVKGTRGYLDAYHINTGKLTRRSDIYAFGVVLLEVLCGRPAVDLLAPEDERILSWWARDKISKGEVDHIVASSLREEISPNSLKTFVEIAERCLNDKPKSRPTMSQVRQQLEFALEQQECKQNLALNEIASVSDSPVQPTMTTTDMQNHTLRPNEKINYELANPEHPFGRRFGTKAKIHKPSRLWPWKAFWSRANSSEKSKSLLSGKRRSAKASPGLFSYVNERQVNDLMHENDRRIDVPFYDLKTILSATVNFSDANKIGEGGFGPVYKGKLPGRGEIAVKRLSYCSCQGIFEFQNEVVLTAKLQHRNLVELLGYCIKDKEKILLYKYMPNRSLDAFIFDQNKCLLLDWKKRFGIILGIARGLLYLHQDSRLRIIHHDLKPSNILLDEYMNPKISDFGLARIVEGKITERSTTRLVGTFGYMSPEYAVEGKFSIKSDVFSFGVVMLEIISGKKNSTQFYNRETPSLLGYVWRLWCDNKALDLVDPTLLESCEKSQVIKCINIGLLCVQEDPNDRPSMSTVVIMLGGETTTLRLPTQPAFAGRCPFATSSSSSAEPDMISNNQLTISLAER